MLGVTSLLADAGEGHSGHAGHSHGHGGMDMDMSMPMSFELGLDTILVSARAPGGPQQRARCRALAHASRVALWPLPLPTPPSPSKRRPQWFKSWHPTTPAGYALSALVLAAVGLAHEALASYRSTLARRAAPQRPGLLHAYAPIPGGGDKERAPLDARVISRCGLAASWPQLRGGSLHQLPFLCWERYEAGCGFASGLP